MSTVEVDESVGVAGDLLNAFADAGLPINAHSVALAASLVVWTQPSYLLSFTVSNTAAAATFVQFHDANALPANGAVPLATFTVAANADKVVAFTLPGVLFRQGVVLASSSTAPTLTLAGANCFFMAQFLPVV